MILSSFGSHYLHKLEQGLILVPLNPGSESIGIVVSLTLLIILLTQINNTHELPLLLSSINLTSSTLGIHFLNNLPFHPLSSSCLRYSLPARSARATNHKVIHNTANVFSWLFLVNQARAFIIISQNLPPEFRMTGFAVVVSFAKLG